jgi:error-prone DNA polymerase
MGFYGPSQLIQDAQRHKVIILPVDIQKSHRECHLTHIPNESKPAIQLGFNLIKNLSADAIEKIVIHRSEQLSIDQILKRAKLNKKDLHALASSDALLNSIGNRHQANWWVNGLDLDPPDLFRDLPSTPENFEPPPPTKGENIIADYNSIGLTLREHPMRLLRSDLKKRRVITAEAIKNLRSGQAVRVVGIVTSRQRPSTSSGVVFVTLEDETGYINTIIWRDIASTQRQTLMSAQLLGVSGYIEKDGQVIHLIAKKLVDYSPLLGKLMTTSRDFH